MRMLVLLSIPRAVLAFAQPSGAQQCFDLDPSDDGTAQPLDLAISEISPGNFIELFDSTAADIDLSATTS